MIYSLNITPRANREIEVLRKAGDKATIKKVDVLLAELLEHPYIGTGKPEELKGNLAGLWSRRINAKDRLVYKVEEDIVTVTVVQARGHYSDKG